MEKGRGADGKETIIMIGDWSIPKQMRNFISTPNISLKRKLAKRFKVYNVDEYKTSCINYKTYGRNENIYLPDKEGTYRKIHKILTYKQSNGRLGCINRDINGVCNIREIVNHYLRTGKRKEEFRREKEKKVSNPLLKIKKDKVSNINKSLKDSYLQD